MGLQIYEGGELRKLGHKFLPHRRDSIEVLIDEVMAMKKSIIVVLEFVLPIVAVLAICGKM